MKKYEVTMRNVELRHADSRIEISGDRIAIHGVHLGTDAELSIREIESDDDD